MPTNRHPVLALIVAGIVASTFSACYPDYPGPPYDSYQYSPGITSYSYGGYVGRRYYDDYYYSDYYRRYDKDRVKLTAGRQDDKPNRPEGYHTREWYERRGYNLNLYKHKHEDSGKTHEGARYQSSSNSGRSHSGDSGRRSSSSGGGSSSGGSSNSGSSSSSGGHSGGGGGGSRR